MALKKNKTQLNKVFNIILNVLTYLFFAICIAALVLSIALKKDADDAASIFGMQFRIVVSDSMEKCDQTDVSKYEIKDIPVKSLLVIELVPENESEAEQWYADLRDGDVLTFKYHYVTQETITHRIVGDPVKNENGGYTIHLEGDNKASENTDTLVQTIDTSLEDSPNYIIGKVVGRSYPVGLIITALKSPVGIICFIIVPCAVIAIFELIRLINALTEGKRKKEREEKAQRDAEFEQMKQQIEMLKRQQASVGQHDPDVDESTGHNASDETKE